MGSFGEDPNKGIDPAAGGLVWVCRRNGAWWPGKILGLDELPEDCIPTTARVGVPVKLLGREDASVDWYNVEKSKRIKAFRCGEFDYCIEKAKESRASGSHHPKKPVKYARREDAINQALELESSRLVDDHPDAHNCESPSSFLPSEESDEDSGGPEDDSESAPELSLSGVSFGGQNRKNGKICKKAIKGEAKRRKTPNDSDDEGNAGVKRMKGLEDLGMGVGSTLKRKRFPVAKFPEFSKRKNRRRTLTKVLESTVMVSSPTGSNFPGASDGKKESNESKKNNSVVLNNSDSTGVSCDIATSAKASRHASNATPGKSRQKENEISSMPGMIPNNRSPDMLFDVPIADERKKPESSQSSHVETKSLGSEEQNESGSTSSGTADIPSVNYKSEKGASEWRLKGKRNSRPRKMDMDDEAETYTADIDRDSLMPHQNPVPARASRSPIKETGGSCRVKTRPISEIQLEDLRGWSWNAAARRESNAALLPPQRSLPYRQSRFTVNPKYESSDFSLGQHNSASGLYDITVEVKTSYRPQQVPYISLMSKLNGRPVIGHPIQIEVLDNGFCDKLINFSECYSTSSSSEFDQSGSDFRGADLVYKRKRARGKPVSKNRSLKARRSRKKSTKTRRNNGPLARKIRKLSSLAGSCRENEEKEKPLVEKLKGRPVIACVPLKMVFSRINAGFNNTLRFAPRLTSKSSV